MSERVDDVVRTCDSCGAPYALFRDDDGYNEYVYIIPPEVEFVAWAQEPVTSSKCDNCKLYRRTYCDNNGNTCEDIGADYRRFLHNSGVM